MRLRSAALVPLLLGLILAGALVPGLASPARAATVTVSGTVTGLNSNGASVPVEDVFVEALDSGGYIFEPRIYAYTAADGTYELELPATGTYRFEIECWGAYDCAEDYAPEPVVTKTVTGPTVLNATLDRWARITGTVKKNGTATAWPNGTITANNDARSYWSSYPGVPVAPNGTFTIEKVAPGTVVLEGSEPWDAEPFLMEVPGQTFTIAPGASVNLTLAIQDWRGIAARAVAPDGTPLPDIRWNIFSRPLSGGAWDNGIQAGPLTTGTDGRMKWTLTDTTRAYTVCFYDDYTPWEATPPATRRLSRCLGGAPDRDAATTWTPSAAQPNVKSDVALPYAFATTPTPTISGTTAVGSTLTANAGTWAPAATTLAYQWLRGGQPITGATGASYQLTASDRGAAISVSVTATRSGYVTTTRTSTATAAVAYGSFTSTPVPTITGTTTVGSTLTASPGAWAPAATFSYQWLRGGTPISGATSATYQLANADAGQAITVSVTGARSGYQSATSASTPTALVTGGTFTTAPTPTISGTPAVGSTLTASAGTWSPAATTVTYRWLRDGEPIDGADAATYQLTVEDEGQPISVQVTAVRTGFTATTRTSAATAPVAGAVFTTVQTPRITGTAKVDATLTAKPGTWAPVATSTTYQWFRAGVAIPGATKTTYRVRAVDVGKRLTVRVTGSRTGYATVTRASAQTAAVKRATFTRSPVPRITGTTKVRSRLTAVVGTWTPAPTNTTYRWYRSGRLIAKATKRTYVLTAADRGKRIKVVVTRSRAGYTTVKRSSAATAAIR